LGLVGQLLDTMVGGSAPRKPEQKSDRSGYSEYSDHDDEFSVKML
jgi:hypothetical protein